MSTQYVDMDGYILRYSPDGVSVVDNSMNTIWNETLSLIHIFCIDSVCCKLLSCFKSRCNAKSVCDDGKIFSLAENDALTKLKFIIRVDGKQADVIGGDGIMITQPLNENSIGE